MAPLLSTIANAAARASGFAKSSLTKIFDNFARVTSGSLGTSTSGSLWNAITGVWYANNGVAETATAPSSYPMATIAFPPNANLSLETITPGGGIAFWETDSGDWWGVVANVSEVQVVTGTTCNANSCCTGSNTCVSNSCCTSTCTANSCCTGSPSACVSNSCCTTSCVSNTCCTCGACPAGTALGSGCNCVDDTTQKIVANTCISNSCCTTACVSNSCCTTTNTCVSNSCCTSTCNANSCCTGSNTCVSNSCCTTSNVYTNEYAWAVQILQSISSTVSVVSSSVLSTTLETTTNGIQSLGVKTSGLNITATGYSDGYLVTSLGTVSALASSAPASSTGTGVILVAVGVPALQGTTVGPFSATQQN